MSLAVRPVGVRSRHVFGYGEERYIGEQIRNLEDQVGRKEIQQGVNYDPRNVYLAEKRLKELRTMQDRHKAVRLEGRERVQAELELKKLEEAITQKWGGKMPTYDEYWMTQKQGGIRYLNLVDRIFKLNKDREYAGIIARWKSLRRGLEPDDKDISNTLHLFKH